MRELEFNKGKKKVATISTTSRQSKDFTTLPRRSTDDIESSNFLVSNKEAAIQCLKALDGNVEYLLVDVERKKEIDLWELSHKYIQVTSLITYKPNDATIESLDLLIRKMWNENFNNKNILIYGNGNLGTKAALRLAEKGANVYLYGRDFSKTTLIVNALNQVLPSFTEVVIVGVDNIEKNKEKFDSIISFVSKDNIIEKGVWNSLKKNCLVIDGGINNYTSQFYKEAMNNNSTCIRLDVRLGFSYSVIPLKPDLDNFFKLVLGKEMDKGINYVAGGVIGEDGDVIVDKIYKPSQIIGLANGIGGVKNEANYSSKDKENIKQAQRRIFEIKEIY